MNSDNLSNETSFYPDVIPPEVGHPTVAKFFVEDSGDERGKGLQGKVAFHRNECVAKLSGVVVSQTTIDTIQITPSLHFADRWFCRYLLHSCDPNLEIRVEQMELWALKDIAVGEYLTIDYAHTDDEVAYQFECVCAAENCRGWIKGRNEEVSEIGSFLPSHARSVIIEHFLNGRPGWKRKKSRRRAQRLRKCILSVYKPQ